jgi:hypothetical protein
MMKQMMSSKKAVFFLGIGLGISLVVLWTSQPAALAQKGGGDLKTLKNAFVGNQVVVYFLNNNPPPAEGQITAAMDLLGRRYLNITTNAGKTWLVDVERIVAMKQKD